MKSVSSFTKTIIALVLILSTLATVLLMPAGYPQNTDRTTLVCVLLLVCLFFFTWAVTLKPASKKMSDLMSDLSNIN